MASAADTAWLHWSVLKTNCLADATREANNDNYTCTNKKEKEETEETTGNLEEGRTEELYEAEQ